MSAPAGRAWLRYGLLGLPLAMAALPLYVTAPRHYHDQLGLGLGLTGAAVLAARLFDTLQDPLLGRWLDRHPPLETPARWTGALLLPLGLLALLQPPLLSAWALAGWLMLSLAVIALAHSLITLPYLALGLRLGGPQEGSNRLNGSREGFGLVGVLLASALLPALLAGATAWLLLALAVLALLLLLAVVLLPRHALAAPAMLADKRHGVWPAESNIRKFLAVYLVNAVSAALPATLAPFFIADVLQAERWLGPLLALYFFAAVLGLPVWVWLAGRFGRLICWRAAMLASVLAFVPVPWLGAGDVIPFAAICVLTGLLLGADLVIPPAMLGALGGEEALTQRYGWWSLCGKLALALAVGLSLPLLQLLGFSSGSGQGLLALAVCYAALPCVFKLLAFGLLQRYRAEFAVADAANESATCPVTKPVSLQECRS
ncbi:MFS transporter [Chitinilyticum piscinae]|uniref:MFS transporter n=1 Tax=Chitinilyticum piscinae TaxID=2866724 RepID=A0A8J7K8C9_9NEIS|nr:MFS transporter [Chitinilyticum piscinae]MBE9609328.1 MFS transporter [Chitinilyticum piscinae]